LGIHGGILMLGAVAWAQDASTPAPVPEWTISSAPARFIIDPDNTDKPVPLTWVNLCLPNPNWTNMPIRVFTDAGVAVGSDLLWTAPGEPATLIFDSSSGAKRYKVYLGSNWPAVHLPNTNSGVILESRASDGKEIDHLPDMLQAWNQSTTVYGRAFVPGLFEGGHRFGPQGNILEHFQGWFETTAPEHLELALISNDASFVLVDGKEVTEWPGFHDFHPGLGGQFQGAVDLTPGVHLLEYYNAYKGVDGHPLLCCLAAKGGAIAQWSMLMPNGNFFRPAGHAHVVDYQLQPGATAAGGAPAFAIDWAITGQSVIGPEIMDIGFIDVQLTCRPAVSAGTVNWTFDDGTTAQGQSVHHTFPRPAMRTVQISAKDGEKDLGSLSQAISVHPNWTQLTTYPPQLNADQQKDIIARDPATLPVPDLAGCVAVFGTFKNPDGLLKLLPQVCARMKEISEADLPYVKDAAVYLAREDLPHYAEASQLLHALVDRCNQDKPSQQLITVGSQSRMWLAHLTVQTSDHTDEARTLLDGVNPTVLTGDDPRLLNYIKAELTLATGDVAGARKQYTALTGDPSGPDARSSVRRTALISQARAFMDKKDLEAAEGALGEVAWRAPIDIMSQDWALTRLRLYQEQNQPLIAYLWAKRLLPVIVDSGRSELLFRLTDLAYAQGDNDLAQKTLSELLKKHPYSQEAAQAKEKWPGKE